jgi:hypothetical protein
MEDREENLRRAKLYVVGANAVETAETDERELTVDDLEVVRYIDNDRTQNWYAELRADFRYTFYVDHVAKQEETHVTIKKQRKFLAPSITTHTFSHHDF